MKIQKFLFATMLCGVFGVFTACSDDLDPVPGDIDTTDPVGEEVETVLVLAANVDNGNFTTRADTEDEGTDPSVNQVQSLAIATFYVNSDDKPGNLISLQTKTGVSPDNQDDKESNGYYMDPIKFKIAPVDGGKAKVAVVALANYGTLFDDLKDGDIKDFEAFKNTTSAKMFNNYGFIYYAQDGSTLGTALYPMSSNVLIYDIEPGYINSVGYNDSENALKYAKSVSPNESFPTNTTVSNKSMIPLYRGAAEIELKTLKFDNYGSLEFDHFILEEVFIMNAPSMVNWFDPTLPNENAYSHDWGGNLNVNFKDYVGKEFTWNKNVLKSFVAGNARVAPSDYDDIIGTIPFVSGEFCSQQMFDNTTDIKSNVTNYLVFKHNKGATGLNSNFRKNAEISGLRYFDLHSQPGSTSKDYYGMFRKSGNNEFSMRIEEAAVSGTSKVKFAVSPSNYSLGENGLVSERAICLVVRGRYYYKSGNQIIGPDNENYSDSRYYTVIVNKEGESTIPNGDVPSHSNCVLRNVRYEISLTISGPGSKTPWDYDENAYVVPKVRIVPFGLVEQDSKLD